MDILALIKGGEASKFPMISTRPRTMTFAQYQLLTPEQRQGEIIVTDYPVEKESDSVSVTASGDTWRSLLAKLRSASGFDFDKITRDSLLLVDNTVYRIVGLTSTIADFSFDASHLYSMIATMNLYKTGDSYRFDWTTTGGSAETSTSSVTDGTKLTLCYNSVKTLELGTLAQNCMLSDGQSVENAVDTLKQNETNDYIDLTTYTQNWYTFPSDGYLLSSTSDNASMTVRLRGATSNFNINSLTKNGENDVIYVRKGMRTILYSSTGNVYLRFYPFTS